MERSYENNMILTTLLDGTTTLLDETTTKVLSTSKIISFTILQESIFIIQTIMLACFISASVSLLISFISKLKQYKRTKIVYFFVSIFTSAFSIISAVVNMDWKFIHQDILFTTWVFFLESIIFLGYLILKLDLKYKKGTFALLFSVEMLFLVAIPILEYFGVSIVTKIAFLFLLFLMPFKGIFALKSFKNGNSFSEPAEQVRLSTNNIDQNTGDNTV